MIRQTVAKWHALLRGEVPGGLDELIADDCVFFSPIIFTPQRGKELTKLYLSAAASMFSGGAAKPVVSGTEPLGKSTGFRYVKETFADRHAILEFEAQVGGKLVNGVDIITCDDAGRIVEFKVMVRPLQAVNLLHERMAAMLETLKGDSAAT